MVSVESCGRKSDWGVMGGNGPWELGVQTALWKCFAIMCNKDCMVVEENMDIR